MARLLILCSLLLIVAACGHEGASIWAVNLDSRDWYVRLDSSEGQRRAYVIAAGTARAIFVDPGISFRGRLMLVDTRSCEPRQVMDIAAGNVDVMIEDGEVSLVRGAGPSQRIYRAEPPAPIPCDPGPPRP
jgi:hypothetical protein